MRSISVNYDHPRSLGYSWRDATDLSRRLGGASLAAMLTRLGEMDPVALEAFLHVGLKNFDTRLTPEQTTNIIQAVLDKGGRPSDLLTDIIEALTVSGVIRVRAEENGHADPPQAAQTPPS